MVAANEMLGRSQTAVLRPSINLLSSPDNDHRLLAVRGPLHRRHQQPSFARHERNDDSVNAMSVYKFAAAEFAGMFNSTDTSGKRVIIACLFADEEKISLIKKAWTTRAS